MLALLSLLGRRSSASSSRWLSRSSPAFDDGALPSTYSEYQALQERLTNKQRAPRGIESFEDLQTHPNFVFRDFTGFFQQMDILEPNTKSVTCLLRGRRWGKTVLGDAWLACLRKEEHLFKGTAVEGRMRDQPLIGVKLDLSECLTVADVPTNLSRSIEEGLEHVSDANKPVWSMRLSDSDLNSELSLRQVSSIFYEMSVISRQTKRKFALFVDEYDALVVDKLHNCTLASEEYLQTNHFMAKFFTMLKAQANKGTIPFQFITGSSRLPMKGMWSGPNAIRDLTFDPGMAEALGYTWPQIEQYFGTQLNWLQHLHQLSREQLRELMEQWYDRHRWSPKTHQHVFNPWSVHQLMTTGEFKAYWAESGSNTRLLNSKLLMKKLVGSLLSADEQEANIRVHCDSLFDSRLPDGAGEPLPEESQKALLVGAGMLAIHPDYESDPRKPSSSIALTIPNLDARKAVVKLLSNALFLPKEFNDAEQVESLIVNNDIGGLIEHMNTSGAFAAALGELKDEHQAASEVLLTMAFGYLLVRAELKGVEHRPLKSLPDNQGKSGQRPTADYVLHVGDTKTTHILEFKLKATRQGKALTKQVSDALQQVVKYKELVKDGHTGLYSVVVFDDSAASPGALEAITKPQTLEQVEAILKQKEEELKKKKLRKQRRQKANASLTK